MTEGCAHRIDRVAHPLMSLTLAGTGGRLPCWLNMPAVNGPQPHDSGRPVNVSNLHQRASAPLRPSAEDPASPLNAQRRTRTQAERAARRPPLDTWLSR